MNWPEDPTRLLESAMRSFELGAAGLLAVLAGAFYLVQRTGESATDADDDSIF